MSKKPNELNPVALTRKQLATLLNETPVGKSYRTDNGSGVTTPQTISNWEASGCPVNPDGTYSLPAIAAWLAIDRKNRSDKSAISIDGASLPILQIEKLKAEIENLRSTKEYRDVKTELETFKSKLQSGEILPRSDVEAEYVKRARYIRETLDGLPSYAPRLQAKNLIEIRSELEAIARDVCSILSCDAEEPVVAESASDM